jgi:hypothetical protein
LNKVESSLNRVVLDGMLCRPKMST